MYMLLVILKRKKLLERFTKMNYKRNNLKEFRIEKGIKINYMLNRKVMIVRLIVGLIKNTQYK